MEVKYLYKVDRVKGSDTKDSKVEYLEETTRIKDINRLNFIIIDIDE